MSSLSSVINDSMTSKEMLDILVAKNMEDARQAKARGDLVCWSSSIAPCEFMETMGIYTVYPENHVVGIAARKGAPELLQYAEAEGYSNDICGYARANLAYMDVQHCVSEEMPLPDMVLLCNNICETLIKWYENIAYTLNIPCFVIDVPYNHDPEVTDENVAYVESQFETIIAELEEITGKKFDEDKFQEVMEVASQNAKDWYDATSLAAAVPSPLNGFNMFNYMALIVCMRGKPECGVTFRKLKSELEEMIKEGKSGLKGAPENHRIMWDGIACWPYLSHTYKVLKNYGINMTGSTYPSAWALRYTPGNLNELARAYTSMGNNLSLKGQIELRENIIREFKCDGVVMHMNRSCKMCDFLQYEVGEALRKDLGVPITTFDGDQADPRNYSKAQYETRIEALNEMMDEKNLSRTHRTGENIMTNQLQTMIQNLCDKADHPARTVFETIKESGRKAVGWVEPYAPVEIIDAAGAIPIGLWGGEIDLKKARTYLPPFACSIMQSIMEMENDNTYDVLSAVLIPANCDTLKCFGQKWKGKCPAIPFVHPQHRNVPAAVDFLANEYDMIRTKLESILDVEITDEAISNSIIKYNNWRQAMRDFTHVAEHHLDIITPNIRHKLIKAYYFMEVTDYTKQIKAITRALHRENRDQYKGKKIVVTGLTLEPPELINIFEQFGFAVVADDLAHESRQFRTDVPFFGDPIHSLAKQWQNHSGCSLAMDPYKERIDLLIQTVRATNADGLVIALMKFCDPEEYDVPIIMKACKNANIPLLTIEIDQQSRSFEQIRTRVQSFAENI